ncbi:hypothetical protein GIB67_042012 [Kingdonia uniflora]|uniref:Uncharacterized protein n=1 Tax=Kingdonia uniflora TaxID=39325 RepID=A0A7J7NZS2_9MAGN|nr:hypothetical protein GIB67_042012 [Kingdonia uniflora]
MEVTKPNKQVLKHIKHSQFSTTEYGYASVCEIPFARQVRVARLTQRHIHIQ